MVFQCVRSDESYPGHSKVVIIAPVESHGSLHIPQVVLRNVVAAVMVVILLVAAPVVGVEAVVFVFLLSVVEDSASAGPGRSVVEDVGQESFVHLNTQRTSAFITQFCNNKITALSRTLLPT